MYCSVLSATVSGMEMIPVQVSGLQVSDLPAQVLALQESDLPAPDPLILNQNHRNR